MNAKGEVIEVQYGTKTWSDQKNRWLRSSDPADPGVVLAEIKAGAWTVVGPATLNGRRALKLAFTGLGTKSYFWVDASSYLPLQETSAFQTGPPGESSTTTVTTHYQFLPPHVGQPREADPTGPGRLPPDCHLGRQPPIVICRAGMKALPRPQGALRGAPWQKAGTCHRPFTRRLLSY